MEAKHTIPVTSPHLPPLEDFIPFLEKIWESRRLTNSGPFHDQLEHELADYLGVEHLSLFANGTLALLTALQALRVTGEVITTPYSFPATSHALLWNGLNPVFVDIDPRTCNLDPARIEEAITPKTTAILPVHCYGIPCDVEGIERIANNYGLKVLYDSAHAFGVRIHGESILKNGDLSILSFHATKVFNTFEGGAIICADAKVKQRIDFLKNFGFANETTVVAPGINGKLNEVSAAFGLLQLQQIDDALRARAQVVERYDVALSNLPGLTTPFVPDGTKWNHAYYPVFIDDALFPVNRDALYERLRNVGVLARRYFFPLLSEFAMYRGLPSATMDRLPNAFKASREVLCLPIYPHLTQDEQTFVIDTIKQCFPNP